MAGNIIPAIATTNAVIAGLIVIEALKILAGSLSKCKTVSPYSFPIYSFCDVNVHMYAIKTHCKFIMLLLRTYMLEGLETLLIWQHLPKTKCKTIKIFNRVH